MTNLKNSFNSYKKILTLCALVCCAVLLTGCGASVDVYAYAYDGGYANEVHIRLDLQATDAMNASSIEAYPQADEVSGLRAWTVEEYFTELMTSPTVGLDYELLSTIKDGELTMAFVKRFATSAELDTNNLYAVPDVVSTTTTNGFLYHRVRTRENPFNGLRTAYDESFDSTGFIGKLKNGMGYYVDEEGSDRYYHHLFPSLVTAFPIAETYDLSDIGLNYIEIGNARRGNNGYEVSASPQSSYYVFERNFDYEYSQVIYDYNTVNTVGWYILAVVIGGIVLLAILFFTSKKKPKSGLVDKFPYNPEKYKDINSNLPY